MNILVLSDTHINSRSNKDLINFIESFKVDYLIHCGDWDKLITYSAIASKYGEKLKTVYGNSDEESLKNILNENIYFELGIYKCGVIHSHQIRPRGNKDTLVDYCIQNQLNIVFYGHTHEKNIIEYHNGEWKTHTSFDGNLNIDSIYLVNPGSLVNNDYLYIRFEQC